MDNIILTYIYSQIGRKINNILCFWSAAQSSSLNRELSGWTANHFVFSTNMLSLLFWRVTDSVATALKHEENDFHLGFLATLQASHIRERLLST